MDHESRRNKHVFDPGLVETQAHLNQSTPRRLILSTNEVCALNASYSNQTRCFSIRGNQLVNGLDIKIKIPKGVTPLRALVSRLKETLLPQHIRSSLTFEDYALKRTEQGAMSWVANQQLRRWKRTRIWAGMLFGCIIFLFFTPKIPRSPNHHHFLDMRNLLGVPSTLNVITNFPFLVVGVLGLVFTLEGGLFNISSQGETFAWALYYAGILGIAFGSAYYHLKPDNSRVLWDTLPMMVAYASLFSCLVIERIGQRIGLCCLFTLLFASFLSVAYERIYSDIRFCVIFQLILAFAIPGVAFMYPSKYTHSTYWFWSTGTYLLAKFEAAADKKIYDVNNYIISGHSLEHLCLALIPILLSVMLFYRELKFQRSGSLKDRP